MSSNLFVDANIIYGIDSLFKESIVQNILFEKNVKLVTFDRHYKSKFEDTITQLNKFSEFVDNSSVTMPDYIAMQCNQITPNIKDLREQFNHRTNNYLFLKSFMENGGLEGIEAGMDIIQGYKRVFTFVDDLSNNPVKYESSKVYNDLLEYVKEVTTILQLKKEDHNRDRYVDEKLSALVLDSAITGNQTALFSCDGDLKRCIQLVQIALANANKITKSKNLESLSSGSITIGKFFQSPYNFEKEEVRPNSTISRFLQANKIDYTNEDLGKLTSATVYFLESAKYI